ncbi:MAG: hypothetical protein E7444_05815 [Ruminococcaceae bacterium]|nr:hypothetical protein [Oscillospiraceae bacterium]
MTPEVKERIEQIRHGNVPEGYVRSKRGIIPQDWNCCRIEDFCFLKSGDTITSSRINKNGKYPCYGGNGLRGYTDNFTHDGRHVLIGRQGALCGNVKFVAGAFYASEHAVVVTTKNNSLMKYCYYLFDNMNLNQYSESSAQPGLSVEKLLRLFTAIPELSEQDRIAQILSAQDEVIELKEKLLEEKQRQKKYLMQRLLTGKKRLPGFDGEWKDEKLGKLFAERSETNCEHLELLAITGTQGVIPRSQLDLKDNSSEDKSKYLRICVGDIGYNTMRMWQGVSAYSNYEGIVSPAYTILKPNSMINAKYFSYLFKMPDVVFLFYRFSQGLVDDTRNLKYENFKKIIVNYPVDIEEQNAIVSILEKADQEIELIRQSVEQEKQKKKALMQLLLTGIVRV